MCRLSDETRESLRSSQYRSATVRNMRNHDRVSFVIAGGLLFSFFSTFSTHFYCFVQCNTHSLTMQRYREPNTIIIHNNNIAMGNQLMTCFKRIKNQSLYLNRGERYRLQTTAAIIGSGKSFAWTALWRPSNWIIHLLILLADCKIVHSTHRAPNIFNLYGNKFSCIEFMCWKAFSSRKIATPKFCRLHSENIVAICCEDSWKYWTNRKTFRFSNYFWEILHEN